MQLDNRTKQMLRELGRAINEAVSDSDRVSETIVRIKSQGYNVVLMLDAIVAMHPADETPGAAGEQRFLKSLKLRINRKVEEGGEAEDSSGYEITAQDLKFLKALKIDVDGLE